MDKDLLIDEGIGAKEADRASLSDSAEDRRIIAALASIYNSLHIIDLKSMTYREIRANYALHRLLGDSGKVFDDFKEIMSTVCSAEYMEKMRTFVDLETLPERMGNEDSIEFEYFGPINGWTNAAFFALDRDEEGNVTEVLLGTRNINTIEDTDVGYKNVVQALSGVYLAAMHINLSDGEISSMLLPVEARKYIGAVDRKYDAAKDVVIEHFVAEEYRLQMSYFMDLSTLADRLRDNRYISMDYIGTEGKWRSMIFTAAQIDEEGVVKQVLLAIEDTHAEKNRQSDLEYQVEHDALTGLLNRSAYEKYTNLYKGTEIPLVFMLIDINKFKQINDTYGHEVGDAVLRDFADALSSHFDSSDLVMRIGGDEFCVLLSGYDQMKPETLTDIVERVNNVMRKGTEKRPATSVSAGITYSAAGFREDTYKNADRALYKAKETEGGCAVVHEQTPSEWAEQFAGWVDK
ncbi:MAG: GGDEF domain-containing protein [Clostridia bacterium]|nr:GGDEF domain-containing protein [Clostridia bacterium]